MAKYEIHCRGVLHIDYFQKLMWWLVIYIHMYLHQEHFWKFQPWYTHTLRQSKDSYDQVLSDLISKSKMVVRFGAIFKYSTVATETLLFPYPKRFRVICESPLMYKLNETKLKKINSERNIIWCGRRRYQNWIESWRKKF